MKRKGPFLGIFIFLLSFSVYLFTLAPTIGFIDCGELTVVSATLGIAHPTGYPLYTLLGRLFTLIPFGSLAQRVNLLSAFFSALTLVSFFTALYFLLSILDPKVLTILYFSSTLSALILGFSTTFWSQATGAEVYNLTALFFSLLFTLLFLWYKDSTPRFFPLIAFILGLAFGNHMSIIHLVPATLILVFLKSRPSMKILYFSLLFFLLGLSIYAYLPLRANLSPLLNWGNPTTLERFLWHVTGKQYRVWMFSGSWATFFKNLKQFSHLLLDQFTPVWIWLGVIGFFRLFQKEWKLASFSFLIFFSDIIYALNYDIPDIEPYFLPAFFIFALWIGVGIEMVMRILKKRLKGEIFRIALLLFLSPPLTIFLSHFRKENQKNNYIPYDYGMNVLHSVEEKGIVITNNWDIYSPILYIRYLEGKRKDVVMIDKELLRRSWYFDYLKKEYPWLIKNSRKEVESFMEMLKVFEKKPSLTEAERMETQMRFIRMINSFISKNIDTRPIYLTFIDGYDVDAPAIASSYQKVPQGLVYKIERGDSIPPFSDKDFSYRGIWDKSIYKDKRTKANIANYLRISNERGIFLAKRGLFGEAIEAFKGGLRFDPKSPWLHLNLGACYMEKGDYAEALKEFDEVLKLEPTNEIARKYKIQLQGKSKKKPSSKL